MSACYYDGCSITGISEMKPVYSHSLDYDGKKVDFYKCRMKVVTQEETRKENYFILVFSQEFKEFVKKGKKIHIRGEVHSFAEEGDDGKKHLLIYVHPREIKEFAEEDKCHNYVYVQGKIKWISAYKTSGYASFQFPLEVVKSYNRFAKVPCVYYGTKYERRIVEGATVRVEGELRSRQFWRDGILVEVYEVRAKKIVKG